MKYTITPWWLTGFTQCDGSFGVAHGYYKDRSIPFYPIPSFSITQSDRERPLMLALRDYLGVGSWGESKGCITIIVRDLGDLLNVIIPHFDAYPLRGGKYISYLIFKYVCILKSQGLHLTLTGYLQILYLSYCINTERDIDEVLTILTEKFGLLPEFTSLCYKHLIVAETPWQSMHPDYIAGIVDGDGSINFSFPGGQRRVIANFTVILSTADRSVLEDLKLYFGCGKINKLRVQAEVFKVITVDEILHLVLPLLLHGQLMTVKRTYIPISREAMEILAAHGVKSDRHLLQVVNLVYNMNQGGKRRKLTKAQYLSKFIKS